MKKVFVLLLSVICLVSCNSNKQKLFNIDGLIQGSYYHIAYYGNENNTIKQGLDSIFKVVNKSVSVWDSTSTVNKINNNINTVLDSIFIKNFNYSEYISNLTDGAFDISVGGLVEAYGFGSKKRVSLTDRQIDSVLQYVGYKNLKIENSRFFKKYPQTKIDFNAIAQGYTVDLICEWLSSKGINNFIVDVGGEVRSKGIKVNGKKWTCGIELPSKNPSDERKIESYLGLENEAIVTSGNYRKFYEENGIKYSHTIDPKTGRSVKHSLLSATVLAKEAWLADGLATAFMVMGLDKAKDFLNKHPEFEAHFIYSDSYGNFQTYTTPNLEKRLTKAQ